MVLAEGAEATDQVAKEVAAAREAAKVATRVVAAQVVVTAQEVVAMVVGTPAAAFATVALQVASREGEVALASAWARIAVTLAATMAVAPREATRRPERWHPILQLLACMSRTQLLCTSARGVQSKLAA